MDTATYTYQQLLTKYSNCITPILELTIGGKKYTSKEIPIMNLEVELTADGTASGCTFSVDSQFKAEASKWAHDFDKNVKAGAELAVKAGYETTKEIFFGYVDEYSFQYSGDESWYADRYELWYQNETDLATAQNIADTLGIATVEQATGIADPIVVVYIAAQ